MGALTTHILDTAHGHPAAAVRIDLYAEQGAGWMLLRSVQTNSDGRCEQ
ncbi:MAG: hydroxyisourate hydrolase, partial [Thiomonas sp.]